MGLYKNVKLVLLKKTIKKLKRTNPMNEIKYVQVTYLTKVCYLEYINNFYSSTLLKDKSLNKITSKELKYFSRKYIHIPVCT